MFRMNDSGRTTACIIVAVLILAILSPTDSRALSVDAIAFELNRSDMQVVVWMPLQTVDQLFDDRASVALSCDVHLGRCNAAENRAILQREVIVKGRYTMLLTVTGEGTAPENESVHGSRAIGFCPPCRGQTRRCLLQGVVLLHEGVADGRAGSYFLNLQPMTRTACWNYDG